MGSTSSKEGEDLPPSTAVPHFQQASSLDCGPTCVRMCAGAVLNGDPGGAREMNEATGRLDGKVVTTLELALTLSRILPRGAATLFFCSTSVVFNEENARLPFYQRYNAASAAQSAVQRDEAARNGVRIEERSVSLAELKCWLAASTPTQPQFLLCLLDWRRVLQRHAAAGGAKVGRRKKGKGGGGDAKKSVAAVRNGPAKSAAGAAEAAAEVTGCVPCCTEAGGGEQQQQDREGGAATAGTSLWCTHAAEGSCTTTIRRKRRVAAV